MVDIRDNSGRVLATIDPYDDGLAERYEGETSLCREIIKILRKEFTDAEIREMLEYEFTGEELGYELNRQYRSCLDTGSRNPNRPMQR